MTSNLREKKPVNFQAWQQNLTNTYKMVKTYPVIRSLEMLISIIRLFSIFCKTHRWPLIKLQPNHNKKIRFDFNFCWNKHCRSHEVFLSLSHWPITANWQGKAPNHDLRICRHLVIGSAPPNCWTVLSPVALLEINLTSDWWQLKAFVLRRYVLLSVLFDYPINE